MTASDHKLLRLIAEVSRGGEGQYSLAALARRAGWSPFHLHRLFTRLAGETPKRFSQRVRLSRAADALRSSDATILDIALESGFESHEVFSRAFRRQFGCSPSSFRMRSRRSQVRQSDIAGKVSPCLGLYRVSLTANRGRPAMTTPSIERRVLEAEQPILFIQRRIASADLQQAMGECYGALYGHGQSAGLAIAGHPMARYVSTGPGLWTVDLIMPLFAPAEPNGEMQAGVLVSGLVAFAVHHGPYDGLPDTNAAIERWIEENGYETGGAPWESFVTDPGETPDPADWRTEIFWPLRA